MTAMVSHILKYRPSAGEGAASQAGTGGRAGRGNALLGAAMLATVLLSGCSKLVTLQANLKDAEANEIALVLNQNGIEVEKHREKEGVLLTVNERDLSRASAAMTAAGLPKRNPANLGEVFKKQGMISSPLEERVRYIYGLSEELGNTLQQFDHVISARVHVVLPERVAPGEPILPSSAAVFVKYRPPLDEDAIMPRIHNLVASSIPGLAGADGGYKISVVMVPTELPPPSIQWTKVGPFKVQAGSAGWLTFTLVVLIALALLAAGIALLEMLKRNKGLGAALSKMMGPVKAAAASASERAGRRAAGSRRT
jgi:type III secretion protein J